jgi:penicillin-binding protein 1A
MSAEDMKRYFDDPEYRKRVAGTERKRRRRKDGGKFLVRAVIATVFVLLPLGLYVGYLFSGLPSLERIENPRPELATRVYAADGEVLDRYFVKNRSYVPIREVPPAVVDALIATEDKDFYSHWGVDAVRFMKAMVKNLLTFRFTSGEGASTITMQLSRNLYLGHKDRNAFETVTRKIREFITSVQLERSFTKDEILEFYLNVVYFGRGSYGIASAAQQYFGRSPAELTLSETALLIALLKGPWYYDPVNHPDRALGRRNVVLGQMEKYGFITREQGRQARAEPLQLKSGDAGAPAGLAPHFVEYVRQQLVQKAEKYGFDLYRDGLTVYTTLDSRMQRHANRAVEEHMLEYQAKFDKLWDWTREREALKASIDLAARSSAAYRKAANAAQRDSVYSSLVKNREWVDSAKAAAKQIELGFVAMDPHSGGILAMVGGSSFKQFKYGLNHVTQIRRQVGSTFKPFVFTVAIDNNYPPCYELLNQPVTLMMADGRRWSPSNTDGSFGGKSTLREGLRKSINLIAVRAIMEIAPVKSVIQYAQAMGITSELPPYESLALGSGEVSPLEMTAAFGVYANKGVYVEPVSILMIEDKSGNIIEQNTPMRREALSEQTSFIMTTMLQDVLDGAGGTGARVRNWFHLPAAGKTGSTNEYADAWFIGFTPQVVAGVWVGFDNKSVHFTNADGQGGRAAAPVWGRFMKYIYDDPDIGLQLEYFTMPAGVTKAEICDETKRLATEFCPKKAAEYFTEKTMPGRCPKHSTTRWVEGEDSLGTTNF